MARTYFTLAVREDGIWAPQFGDYDRECVKFEMDDMRDHPNGPKAKDMKIVKSGARQADIVAAIAELNTKEQ